MGNRNNPYQLSRFIWDLDHPGAVFKSYHKRFFMFLLMQGGPWSSLYAVLLTCTELALRFFVLSDNTVWERQNLANVWWEYSHLYAICWIIVD